MTKKYNIYLKQTNHHAHNYPRKGTHQKALTGISKLLLSSCCISSEKHKQVVRHLPSACVTNAPRHLVCGHEC